MCVLAKRLTSDPQAQAAAYSSSRVNACDRGLRKLSWILVGSVIGANTGFKLFVALQLEVAHDFIERFALVDARSLPITHDFLATMLGTDRPSVSEAAGVLQKKKLIEYTSGAVKIVHRKKLEYSACEWYEVIQQYDGELGLK